MHLCLFRQEFPASGQMIASDLSWKVLTQSKTTLQGYTILLPYFVPNPGSMSAIPQSSHTGLRWWLDQLNGEHVSVQFPVHFQVPLHTGTTILHQLVPQGITSLSLVHSQAARQLSFLGTQTGLLLSPTHQMVHFLYQGVMIEASSSGMYKLVELSKPSMATLTESRQCLFQQITP